MFRLDDIDTWEPVLETLNGRPGHRWPDGRWLPVIAGAEGEGGPGSGPGPGSGSGSGGQGGGQGAGAGDGGAGGAGSGAGSGSGGGSGSSSGGGFVDEDGEKFSFPANTPLVEMSEAQRTEYWRHKAKKHEGRYKGLGDVDEMRRKAGEFDKLAENSKSDQDRAVEQARTEAEQTARTDERRKAAVRLVDAEMRAVAAGRLDAEKLKALLEPIDRTKFLTSDGEVDTEKVASFVASVAPASDDGGKGGKNGRRFPDTGQGRRGGDAGGGEGHGTVESGRDRYRARQGRQQQQNA